MKVVQKENPRHIAGTRCRERVRDRLEEARVRPGSRRRGARGSARHEPRHLGGPRRLRPPAERQMYADDESFTLTTPEGHMFAGWITFSAHSDDGGTVAQAQVLMRAQNPLSEVGLTLGGHRKEDRFWADTLTALAKHFETDVAVETEVVCVDRRRQWRRAGNIRHDAAIRTTMYSMTRPFRRRRDA